MDREDMYEFLKRSRDDLIVQCQEDIFDHMYDLQYFTLQDYNEIISYDSREEKIICFLDMLPSKSKKAFEAFISYLSTWYWWIPKKYSQYLQSNDDVEEIRSILNEAEVPSLPLQHVTRKDEYVKLNDYLHAMNRGEYVVVHGMGGCGKSTLVIEVLQKSSTLVLDAFKKKIFWLMVGRESAVKKDAENESKVKELTILQELYTRLFITRGYNAPPLPLDIDDAKRRLKEKLNEADFRECLLILDDVPSSNFIDCFNIGCKILVTTDNKNVMKTIHNPIQYVRVSEGFTENESLALFSKNLSSSELPHQSKHIHALCKGFPLTISLVASQLADFKEDVLCNNHRWDAYVEHLKNKDIEAAIGRCDQYRQDQITSLYKALGMSIGSLSPTLQRLYQDFALFMDDVNIKPEVLSTLWDMARKDVEDSMLEFEKKCLVIKTWNVQLKSYVYCVHDLLLDYLKRKLTTKERQALHQKLISQYKKNFGDNIVEFPRNDNYIFLYLGYHLKEAGYLDEFPELYLNLEFIEAKILIHGAADVLYDFKKYKDFITNNEENTKKYEEFYNFVSRIGICRAVSESNVIQFALAECRQSYVYKMGQELAKNSSEKYFEYLTEVPKECSSPDVHPLRGEKITAAIFSSDGNVILANTNNVIKFINVQTHETIVPFEGHLEKITLLRLSPHRIFFLSASNDSSVRIWYLNSYGDAGNPFNKPRTPSPALAQKAWKDSFAKQRNSGEKPSEILYKHNLPITDARFSPSGMKVVTSSKDEKVIIWTLVLDNRKGSVALISASHKIIHANEVVVSCCFTEDEEYVICSPAEGSITIYDTLKCDPFKRLDAHSSINFIAVIPDVSDLLVKLLLLGENRYFLDTLSRPNMNRISDPENWLYTNTLNRRKRDECICAAISNNGKYIAVAPTNYCILVKEIKTGKEFVKFHETNGSIRGLTWSYDDNAILSTYESALFKIWHLPKETDDKMVKLKASVFDAAWIPDQEDGDENDGLLVTAVLDTENRINIFHNLRPYKTITEQISGSDICHLCVCPVDGHVIYATKNGTIRLVTFEEWKTHTICDVKCHKILKMKMYYYQGATVLMILVEIIPKKYSLNGWINHGGSGDSVYFGDKIVYVDGDDSILDFGVDLKETAAVHVAKTNHTCDIYDLKTAIKVSSGDAEVEDADDTDQQLSESAKFVEFPPSFRLMASGNQTQVVVTDLNKREKCVLDYTEIKPVVCKFSFDEKYFAVGFSCGLVRFYDTESKQTMEFKNRTTVYDLIWSPQDYRLLVILDREIALLNVSPNECSLISITYMSVDKVVCNHSFTKIVTVDNGGHFHVLKHPL